MVGQNDSILIKLAFPKQKLQGRNAQQYVSIHAGCKIPCQLKLNSSKRALI